MNKEEILELIKDMLDNDKIYFLLGWRTDGRVISAQNGISPMNVIYFLEAEKFKILSGLRILNANDKIH